MIETILKHLPFLQNNALIYGTILIVITSIIFMLRIESISKNIQKQEDQLAGDAQSVLTRLLFPLCTALPNFIFAYTAISTPNKAYLVITSNVGNNVTNITVFAGLILLIGFFKRESMETEESTSIKKEFNFLLLSTIILFACLWDGQLTRQEGVILTCCFFYSMADVFKFQLKDLQLILTVSLKLVPFFLFSGFFIYIGSELIIGELEKMGSNINSSLYEVLLPGFVLVLPSILPLVLMIAKKDMQKIALAGIIGDCAFSVPLIIGIVACFQPVIEIQKSMLNYLLITSAIAFFCFNLTTGYNQKGKLQVWKIIVPFIGYLVILAFSAKGN